MAQWTRIAKTTLALGLALSIPGCQQPALEQEKVIAAEGIEQIEVSLPAGNIEATVSADNTFSAGLYASGTGKDTLVLNENRNGKTLILQATSKGDPAVSFGGVTLKLKLPKQQWEALKLRSDSGTIHVQDVQAESFDLNSQSGDVKTAGLTGNSLKVEALSGKVEMAQLDFQDVIQIKNTGNQTGQDVRGGRLDFATASGDVTLTNLTGQEIKAQSDAGNVKLVLSSAGKQIDLSGQSGALDLTLPAGASFEATGKTGSGQVNFDYPGAAAAAAGPDEKRVVAGTGASKIKMETRSGNINLGQ